MNMFLLLDYYVALLRSYSSSCMKNIGDGPQQVKPVQIGGPQ